MNVDTISDWNLCCARGSSSPRNFDASYIFTINLSHHVPVASISRVDG